MKTIKITFYVGNYTVLALKENQDSIAIQLIQHWEKLQPNNELYILKGDYHERHGNYKLAEENYLLAHCMVPSRQRARVRLAFLYKEMGLKEQARQVANEVLNEEVKIYGFDTYRLHQQLNNLFK